MPWPATDLFPTVDNTFPAAAAEAQPTVSDVTVIVEDDYEAHFSSVVDPVAALEAYYFFEYGPNLEFGYQTATASAGSDGPVPVSGGAMIPAGLGNYWYVRIVAYNIAGLYPATYLYPGVEVFPAGGYVYSGVTVFSVGQMLNKRAFVHEAGHGQ